VEAKPVEGRKILLLELLLLTLKQEREIEERLQLEEKVVEEGAQPYLDQLTTEVGADPPQRLAADLYLERLQEEQIRVESFQQHLLP
jgi:hypothetical protein